MRKFILLVIMCLFGGLSSSLMAQETVHIGNGGTNTLQKAPFDLYAINSVCQQIYTVDEFTTYAPNNTIPNGVISKLTFYENTGQNLTCTNIKVYMKHTDKEAFSSSTDWITDFTDGDLVFDSNGATLSIVNGVLELTLTTPFTWNRTQSILVYVDVNSKSSATAKSYFKAFSTQSKKTLYYSGNSTAGLDVSNWRQGSSPTTSKAQMGFTFTSSTPVTPTLPDAPTLTSPTNGETGIFNPSLNFTLSSNTTQYQIFLAEAAGTGAGAYNALTDWVDKTNNTVSYQTNNLKPNTTYYWYVVAKNDEGEVSSAEYSFTTSNFGVPGIPTLVYPENNATIAENPNLSWTFGDNTDEYQLLFGTDPDNLDVVQEWTSTLATSYQTNNLAVGDYFWKVVAKNYVGETSSEVFKFTKLGAPDNVTPISPADGATEVSNKTIRFTFAPNTTHYRFLYGEESAGNLAYCGHGTATEWLETGGATEMEITAPYFNTGKTYYWAVDVKNGSGQRTVHQGGDAIDVFHFTTSSISAATNLRSELNNREVTLSWFYGNSNTVDEYQVLFGTDQDNLVVVQDWTSRGGLSEGSFIKDGLDAGTTYYWQVKVRKDGGNALSSEIASFTTDSLPSAVTYVSPADNASLNADPELSWTFGEYTEQYQVWLGTDSDNLDVVQDWTSTLATSYQTSALSANVTYYWQVNVRNNMGEVQGAIYSFIKSIRPDNVTPISPVHGETGVSNVATITWRFAPNTTHYRLLFDRGYGLEYQIGNNETWVKVTEETASFDTDALGLGALKTYSWAVEVKNDYGTRYYYNGANPSGDVTLYSYTTANVVAATYQAPANNSVLSTSTATLKWTYGANNTVTHYQVLFGTDKNNLDVVQDWAEIPTVGTGLGDGTYTTVTLTNNTKYYWQVNVKQGDDGTPLKGKIWGFVSLLDIPQNVTTDAISYDGTAHITWDAIADATSYNIYVDGTLYSTVNTNAADIANLVYNGGNAYSIQITAVYEFDGDTYESDKSDAVKVTTIGYGMIKVFVKDYKDNRLNGVAITLSGKDIYGNDKEYTFTTNANGTYTSSKPEICEGTYTVTISKDLYFTQTIENVVIVNNETRDLGTIILHSMAIFNVTVNNVNVDYLDIWLGYDSDNTFDTVRLYNIYVWEIHEDTYDTNYIARWFSIGATQGENIMYRYFEWDELPNGVYRIGVELPGSGIINWSNVNAYKNYYIFEKNGNWYDSENWRSNLMPQLPDDQVYIYAPAVVNKGETVTIGNATIKYDNKDYFGALTINGEFIATTDIGIVNESFHRLILNDGAQLRQKNNNLPGKFVMNIDNPTVWSIWNKTGWQFISSPFTNAAVSQFTNADTYDLYKFDGRHENLTVEWRNHKDPEANFETEFVSGRGYMASYQNDTTATFSGTFYAGTSITYPVTYKEIIGDSTHWPNFHLVGNPFTFNMDLSKLQTFHMATGVAIVNEVGGWNYMTTGTINVGDGFFVRTVGVNPSVSYNDNATRSSNNNVIDNISVIISNKTSRDNVVLNFAGADKVGFPKLNNFNEEIACLYVSSDAKRYGIFNYDEDVREVPLSFEAQKMGNYTISVEAEGEYDNIILVDRLTGIETNMLFEDYNFTTTTSKKENADRFIVRFAKKSDAKVETDRFAYQSGEELIIEAEGTVQMFDVMGRMVYSNDVEGQRRVNVEHLNKAAYILRLVNGNGVKVQKVIIY